MPPVSLECILIDKTEESIRPILCTHSHGFNFKPSNLIFADSIDSVSLTINIKNEFMSIELKFLVASVHISICIALLRHYEIKILAPLTRMHQEQVRLFARQHSNIINQ